MISYDKQEIRENLTLDNIFDILVEFGGEPEYTDFGILSTTICHNEPGDGSRKLYYYENSGLFNCYTGCGESFDVFELVIKTTSIQKHLNYDLNDAVRWVAYKFGILGSEIIDEETHTEEWKILANYERIQDIELKDYNVKLKEYDMDILNRFNYSVAIKPWLDEDILAWTLIQSKIGFYPGGDQITIPHFDKDGRLIGIRGRTLCLEEAEKYGKYRPLIINKQQYNHPLGMNLYNLNNSKYNIEVIEKAIIFESEKSCLKYQSLFGPDADISVACCGSNISAYQIQMLIDAGAKEIIIALDRQFQEIGDSEFKHLTKNLTKLHNKYKNYVVISLIFDKNMITSYKASPIDEGKDKFLQLFNERITL